MQTNLTNDQQLEKIIEENNKLNLSKKVKPGSIAEYMQHINTICEKDIPQNIIQESIKMGKGKGKDKGKSKDEDKNKEDNESKGEKEKNKTNIVIPTVQDCASLFKYNYTIPQLKMIAKLYNLKLSGVKKEMLNQIFVFLKLYSHIIKFQKAFRGWLQRKCNFLHGPAYLKKNRTICTNDSDFLSGDSIADIDNNQFFSYTDTDNFTYGFDTISLHNLIVKSGGEVKNPYNRSPIQLYVISKFKSLIRVSRALKKCVHVLMEDSTIEISQEKTVELRVIALFQNINSLGNYSEFKWFLSLSRQQLIRFTRELADIWYYRAQITQETKQQICPSGDPFQVFNFNYMNYEINMNKIRGYILQLLEKILNSGVNRDSKALGAYYILGALTIVNEDAAASLPWLFQSFSHF